MSAESAYFFWEHLGTFLVRDGKEIIVDPLPGGRMLSSPSHFGYGYGRVAASTGFLTLHASAVAINGGVVAFIGRKGQGKSTMAATLMGGDMMADDMIALDLDETGCPMVPLVSTVQALAGCGGGCARDDQRCYPDCSPVRKARPPRC